MYAVCNQILAPFLITHCWHLSWCVPISDSFDIFILLRSFSAKSWSGTCLFFLTCFVRFIELPELGSDQRTVLKLFFVCVLLPFVPSGQLQTTVTVTKLESEGQGNLFSRWSVPCLVCHAWSSKVTNAWGVGFITRDPVIGKTGLDFLECVRGFSGFILILHACGIYASISWAPFFLLGSVATVRMKVSC